MGRHPSLELRGLQRQKAKGRRQKLERAQKNFSFFTAPAATRKAPATDCPVFTPAVTIDPPALASDPPAALNASEKNDPSDGLSPEENCRRGSANSVSGCSSAAG